MIVLLVLLTFSFISPGYASGILDLVYGSNNALFAFLRTIMGTKDDYLGGFTVPVDSRIVAAFSTPYYLNPTRPTPRDNFQCQQMYALNPIWQKRYEDKINGIRNTQPPFYSLVDTPEEMAGLSEQHLECLFYLGHAPPRIPLGSAYGRVYSVGGNAFVNDFSQIFWGGKIFVRTPCDEPEKEMYLSINHAVKAPAAFAELYIASQPKDSQQGYYPGEIIDDEPSLWVDYSADFRARCPPRLPKFYDSEDGLITRDRWGLRETYLGREMLRRAQQANVRIPSLVGRPGALFAPSAVDLGMFSNVFPIREICDNLRWVGRDEEYQVDIFLARAMFNFPEGLRTVGWFNIKTTDLLEIPIIHQANMTTPP